MNVVENTDSRLVIEHRPWLLAGALWLMALAALWAALTGADIDSLAERLLVLALGLGTGFAAWYWFAFLRITFDRDRGQVEHLARRPFGSQWKYLDIDRIRRARLEATWDDRVRMTRLLLDTEDGPAQLEYGYTSADRTALEDIVNEWLTRPVGPTAPAPAAPVSGAP